MVLDSYIYIYIYIRDLSIYPSQYHQSFSWTSLGVWLKAMRVLGPHREIRLKYVSSLSPGCKFQHGPPCFYFVFCNMAHDGPDGMRPDWTGCCSDGVAPTPSESEAGEVLCRGSFCREDRGIGPKVLRGDEKGIGSITAVEEANIQGGCFPCFPCWRGVNAWKRIIQFGITMNNLTNRQWFANWHWSLPVQGSQNKSNANNSIPAPNWVWIPVQSTTGYPRVPCTPRP